MLYGQMYAANWPSHPYLGLSQSVATRVGAHNWLENICILKHFWYELDHWLLIRPSCLTSIPILTNVLMVEWTKSPQQCCFPEEWRRLWHQRRGGGYWNTNSLLIDMILEWNVQQEHVGVIVRCTLCQCKLSSILSHVHILFQEEMPETQAASP